MIAPKKKKQFAAIFKKRPSVPILPEDPGGRPPHVDWAGLLEAHYYEYGNSVEEKENRGQGVFHPSAGLLHGQGHCLRQIVLDLVCAPRSATMFPAKLLRIFEAGSNRHIGILGALVRAGIRHFRGVVNAQEEVKLKHPWLPLAGSADAIVTMATGHRYVIDFKTVNAKGYAKLVKPSETYTLQVNTYMGMAGIRAGYILYENKDSQEFAKPMENFRVSFDPKLYAKTEAFCGDVLVRYVRPGKLPLFDDKTCERQGCAYTAVCDKALLVGTTALPEEYDLRDEEMRTFQTEAAERHASNTA